MDIDLKEKVTSQIHPTAHIDPTARLGANVSIGAGAVIGPQVQIGDNCKIGPHAIIHSNTIMGSDNLIYSFATIGVDPQDILYQNESTWLHIGNANVIREYVSISRGSTRESAKGITTIGDKNNLLAYTHVGHDCKIGNEILMVNHAALSGHVIVDHYAIIGAFSAVHQFCRVGSFSFLCRATQVPKDVPPFMMVTGNPGCPCGLNVVGLKRHGFALSQVRGIKKAYQILYRSNYKLDQAVVELGKLVKDTPEVQMILDSITESTRGICR